jgi:hypothetical protein
LTLVPGPGFCLANFFFVIILFSDSPMRDRQYLPFDSLAGIHRSEIRARERRNASTARLRPGPASESLTLPFFDTSASGTVAELQAQLMQLPLRSAERLEVGSRREARQRCLGSCRHGHCRRR